MADTDITAIDRGSGVTDIETMARDLRAGDVVGINRSARTATFAAPCEVVLDMLGS
jgi:hypothetical protein